MPRYERLNSFFKEKGVECVTLDSDGHLSQILEVLYPTGIDGVTPMEIAANNDPQVYLQKYPRTEAVRGLFIMGGIDKRELHFSRKRVRAEVAKRYRTARKCGRGLGQSGGQSVAAYIPLVDHDVPPGVPLRSFLYMVELSKGFAAGEDLDTFEPPCVLEEELGPIEETFDLQKAIEAAEKGERIYASSVHRWGPSLPR